MADNESHAKRVPSDLPFECISLTIDMLYSSRSAEWQHKLHNAFDEAQNIVAQNNLSDAEVMLNTLWKEIPDDVFAAFNDYRKSTLSRDEYAQQCLIAIKNHIAESQVADERLWENEATQHSASPKAELPESCQKMLHSIEHIALQGEGTGMSQEAVDKLLETADQLESSYKAYIAHFEKPDIHTLQKHDLYDLWEKIVREYPVIAKNKDGEVMDPELFVQERAAEDIEALREYAESQGAGQSAAKKILAAGKPNATATERLNNSADHDGFFLS